MGDDRDSRLSLPPRWSSRRRSSEVRSTSLPDYNKNLVKLSELSTITYDNFSHWSTMRQRVYRIVESIQFKLFSGLVIIVNLGLVVAETDAHAKGEAAPGSTHQAIFGLLMFYIIELILRFFVYRFDFFKSWLNTFDFLVVAVDILVEVLHEAMHHEGRETNLSILRIFRLVKALRVLRMFLAFRELFLMLHGLLSALKAILWASFLISILLTIWSIVVVEYIHPLNLKLAEDGTYNEVLCPRCRHAFESVIMSNLTFLQNIIVGTEETPVTVPLMEHHPWTALVFVPLTLILQLALLNLVVAVVCDAAQQSRLRDEHLSHTERAEQMEHAKGRLLKVITEMDRDCSGTLTKEELMNGLDTEPEFAVLMQLMDIGISSHHGRHTLIAF